MTIYENPLIPVTGSSSVVDNHKRPLKGVTFSRSVVVDLGKDNPVTEAILGYIKRESEAQKRLRAKSKPWNQQ